MERSDPLSFLRITRAFAGLVATLAVFTLTACATTPTQRQIAGDRLAEVWAADNVEARKQLGSRTIKATADQAYRAAKGTMPRIGLEIDVRASNPPTVTARSLYKGGGFSWSPSVRQAEETRMRRIFVEAIGRMGALLNIKPVDEIITATARVGGAPRGSSTLTIDFASAAADGRCPPAPQARS